MLESLTAQENALLTLFNGTEETEHITFTVNVTPDSPVAKQILLRFSSKLGILPVDNLAGEPVWIDITDRQMTAGYGEDTKKQPSKPNAFLYYRIPGRASVRIYNNRLTLFEDEIQIAQFGKVEVVSTTIMGKNADTKITFDTTTGNIKGINE